MAVVANSYDPNSQQSDNSNGQGLQNSTPTQNSTSSGTNSSGNTPANTNTAQQPANNTPTPASYNVSGNQATDTNRSSAAPTNTSSGQFTNLNAYLKANQGYNAAGGGLAGQVNSNLQNQSNQIGQNINSAQQTFNNGVAQGTTNYDANYVNNVLANPYQYLNGNTSNSTSANGQMGVATVPSSTSPTLSADAPGQPLANWNNYLNASYTGPTSLDPSQQLNAQTQNFQQLANQGQTENGRLSLLSNLYNNNNYSAGQQSLDNLFLQSNPSQLAQIQKAGAIGNQLVNQYNTAGGQGQQAVNNATTTDQNTAAQTQAALNAAITGFGNSTDPNSYVGQLLSNATNQQGLNYNSDLTKLQAGQITGTNATAWGLPAGATATYGVDPSQYLSQSTVTPTAQSVISQDDLNKINALGTLGGSSISGAPSQILNTYAGDTLAGSYANAPSSNFNTSGFLNAIQNAQGAYNNQLAPITTAQSQAQNVLTGNDYINGGINSAISNYGNQLKSQAANALSISPGTNSTVDNLLKQIGATPGNSASIQTAINNMSPSQLIATFGEQGGLLAGTGAQDLGGLTTKNGIYSQAQNNGYGNFLLSEQQAEQQKASQAQAQLAALQKQYQIGNNLTTI